ncbi:MAG: hypothetical protein AAGI38_20165 [Bacteroidota bacterium]
MKRLTITSLFLVLALMGTPLAATAQTFEPGDLLRIQLGRFTQSANPAALQRVAHLGQVKQEAVLENAEGFAYRSAGQPVTLGTFLEEATARRVLSMVRQQGFPDAFIEKASEVADNTYLTHAVQVTALKTLDVEALKTLPPGYELYITYENGYYKVLTLLHDPQYKPENLADRLMELQGLGYTAYIRKFR